MAPAWWPFRRDVDSASRWVVVDVETTGLDAQRCELLAIAAVAVQPGPRGLTIVLPDSFEIGLRRAGSGSLGTPVDKHNILLHHIGIGEQESGVAPAEAMAAFEHWLAGAPLLGFHVGFDRDVLQRVARQLLGRPLAGPWIDIAPLAGVAHPDVKARALDEWIQHFDIPCTQRHRASADVLATAELLLRLWPALQRQGAGDLGALRRLASQGRWLSAS